MYYVYILRCEGDRLYTGITTDVQRRFAEHSGQNGRGAKFTRSHKVQSVAAVWSTADRSLASKLEYRIKALTRQKKLELIENDDVFARFFGDEMAALYMRENVEDICD